MASLPSPPVVDGRCKERCAEAESTVETSLTLLIEVSPYSSPLSLSLSCVLFTNTTTSVFISATKRKKWDQFLGSLATKKKTQRPFFFFFAFVAELTHHIFFLPIGVLHKAVTLFVFVHFFFFFVCCLCVFLFNERQKKKKSDSSSRCLKVRGFFLLLLFTCELCALVKRNVG